MIASRYHCSSLRSIISLRSCPRAACNARAPRYGVEVGGKGLGVRIVDRQNTGALTLKRWTPSLSRIRPPSPFHSSSPPPHSCSAPWTGCHFHDYLQFCNLSNRLYSARYLRPRIAKVPNWRHWSFVLLLLLGPRRELKGGNSGREWAARPT